MRNFSWMVWLLTGHGLISSASAQFSNLSEYSFSMTGSAFGLEFEEAVFTNEPDQIQGPFQKETLFESADRDSVNRASGYIRPNHWTVEMGTDVNFTGNAFTRGLVMNGFFRIDVTDWFIISGPDADPVQLTITAIPTVSGNPALTSADDEISYSVKLLSGDGAYGKIASRQHPERNRPVWATVEGTAIDFSSGAVFPPMNRYLRLNPDQPYRLDVQFTMKLSSNSGVLQGEDYDSGPAASMSQFFFYLDVPEGYSLTTLSGFDYSMPPVVLPPAPAGNGKRPRATRIGSAMLIGVEESSTDMTYQLQSAVSVNQQFEPVTGQSYPGNGGRLLFSPYSGDASGFFRVVEIGGSGGE